MLFKRIAKQNAINNAGFTLLKIKNTGIEAGVAISLSVKMDGVARVGAEAMADGEADATGVLPHHDAFLHAYCGNDYFLHNSASISLDALRISF